MRTLRAALLIAHKDLRIEARTGEVLVSTGLFALLVTVLSSLSFYIDPTTARRVAPGVLWVTITFAGVLAMGRSWARERENQMLRGLLLTPIPRPAIYLGKALGSLLFMLAVDALLLPVVGILFQLGDELMPVLGRMVALLFLGSVGFVVAGTLFSVMTVRTSARDLVLSIVLFPLVSPALLAGVVATREVLAGAPMEETWGWIRILLAFDLVFLAGGWVLFEPLASD